MRTVWMGMAAAAMAAGTVSAHHAMEFIETESYTTSRRGEFLFHLHYDYYVEDKLDPGLDHWEVTPGLAYGITDRLMFDVHTHFAKFGNGLLEEDQRETYAPNGPSPFMEAAAFTLQYRLTEGWPVEVGLAATYELPYSRAKSLLGSEEAIEGTLILARSFGQHGVIVLNLTAGWEGDEDYQEFALGVKESLTGDAHGVSAGVELLGSFDDFKDSLTVLPGIYFPLGQQAILKTGIEFGLDNDYLRYSAIVMHRF